MSRRKDTATSKRGGDEGDRREGERGIESRRNPAEPSAALRTGVCRVPDPRPSPYGLHRGPPDGGPSSSVR